MNKKTKIVATISDRRCDVDFIQSLYDAGMNAVRINTAHVTRDSASVVVDNVRKVSDQIAIMIDTKGPEIRITGLSEECSSGIVVAAGDLVNVMGTSSDQASTADAVYLNDPTIYNSVPVGACLLIDDGEMELKVIDKADSKLICEIQNGGVIKSRKSVNIPGVSIELPSVTAKDREFIEWAIEKDLDFIAHSFVRTRADVLEVKEIINTYNSPIKIISKIENQEGVDNIDEILLETYGVMVARGDLGVEIPAEQIPVTQRLIVNKCIESKSPVIIATQMLHSMINNPRPTRAEISDVANAIYQKADAIMLSGETANGDYPVEAVTIMTKVAMEIERDALKNEPNSDMNMVRINNEITAQLARSTVRASVNLPIEAIVIDSLSGRTARYLSAFRGQKPVYAVCYRAAVMRQLSISFGIHAIYQEPSERHNDFLSSILFYLEKKQWLAKDDMIIVVGGSFGASRGASFLEIGTVLNLESKSMNA